MHHKGVEAVGHEAQGDGLHLPLAMVTVAAGSDQDAGRLMSGSTKRLVSGTYRSGGTEQPSVVGTSTHFCSIGIFRPYAGMLISTMDATAITMPTTCSQVGFSLNSTSE